MPLLFLVSFLTMVSAEEEAPMEAKGPVLNKGDITKLIDTYPKIVADFEALGEKFQNKEDMSALLALSANEEANAIFSKYGWDSKKFYQKLITLSTGFAHLEMEKQFANLSEQELAMVQYMMGSTALPQIHPKDLEMLRAKQEELTKFCASLE
jgi:hypothetical protein